MDHPNSPIVAFDTDTGPTVISVAFLAQNVNGIIFAAFDEVNKHVKLFLSDQNNFNF